MPVPLQLASVTDASYGGGDPTTDSIVDIYAGETHISRVYIDEEGEAYASAQGTSTLNYVKIVSPAGLESSAGVLTVFSGASFYNLQIGTLASGVYYYVDSNGLLYTDILLTIPHTQQTLLFQGENVNLGEGEDSPLSTHEDEVSIQTDKDEVGEYIDGLLDLGELHTIPLAIGHLDEQDLLDLLSLGFGLLDEVITDSALSIGIETDSYVTITDVTDESLLSYETQVTLQEDYVGEESEILRFLEQVVLSDEVDSEFAYSIDEVIEISNHYWSAQCRFKSKWILKIMYRFQTFLQRARAFLKL
jgi:hypothetical protein